MKVGAWDLGGGGVVIKWWGEGLVHEFDRIQCVRGVCIE